MKVQFKVEKNIEALVKLSETVHSIHHVLRPDVFDPYDEEKFRVWFTDFLERRKGFCVFVKLEEKYIGYALIKHKKPQVSNPFNNPDFQTLYIDQISFDPAYQNMGMGKELIEFIKGMALRKGVHKVQLEVWNQNEKAVSFFKKNGFETIREVLEVRL